MKRIIYIALAALTMLAISACQQLEEINDRLDDHEDRIAALEEQCRKLNSNIEALQTITTALQQNDYVTKITCIEENGQEIGYRMTFAKSGEVTVYNSIADGTTPQFKISEGYWYASFDDGATWHQLGKVGAESAPEPLFTDVTFDEDYVYLSLADGTTLSIPVLSDDEQVRKVTLTSSLSVSTHEGYVLPKQTVGQPVTFGSHSSSYLFVIPSGVQVHIEPAAGGSYGFALCDTDDNVIEYTTNAASHSFSIQYAETHLWASAPKLGTTYYTIKYKAPESNYWTGKTIWWCGTSIPAGGYPQMVGEMLGADVINTAVGGSMCRANVRTGDYNGVNISNITSSLSMTQEEVEYFIENYDSIRQLDKNSSLPATLEASYHDRMRQGSFEVKLLPYLDGTKPMPDLWIMDHGHNDWKYRDSKGNIDIALEPTRANIDSGELAEDTFMTERIDGVPYARLQRYLGSFDNIDPAQLDDFVCSLNRNCYYGAMNFITTLILVHNPRARFMVIGNYSNEKSGETGYAALVSAQKAWAADWCFPFCDIASCLGTSLHIIPGTNSYENIESHYDTDVFHIYCPDGVHPSSDESKYALSIYAGIVSEFIKQHR